MSATVALRDVCAFITKGATPTTYGLTWQKTGVPFLRSECVSDTGLDMRQSMYISVDADVVLKRSQVAEGDILMTITGNVGRVVRLTGLRRANINQHIARIRVKDPRVDPHFVYYYLSQPRIREYYESIVTGQAYPQISLVQVRETRLPLLPLSEQRQIAEALSDADGMIASLEHLITKKQAIKQGMMQELLTGRTRLPGFDGEWNDVSLGHIATVTMGQSPAGATYNTDSHGIPLVQGNADIRDRMTFDRVWTTAPTNLCKLGDVILTVRAPVGYTAIASRESCLGRGVCALSTNADNRFLFHALVYVEPSWALYEQGSTFTAVNSNEVRSFTLTWPADADERSAIAHVLDDADNELRILELRLGKARAIKQGMMQELLTGRTRLPVREAVA